MEKKSLSDAVGDVLEEALEVGLPRAVEQCGGLDPASKEQRVQVMDWGRKVMLLKIEYLKAEREGDRAKRLRAEKEIIKAQGEGPGLFKDSKLRVVVDRVRRGTTLASREAFTRAQQIALGLASSAVKTAAPQVGGAT